MQEETFGMSYSLEKNFLESEKLWERATDVHVHQFHLKFPHKPYLGHMLPLSMKSGGRGPHTSHHSRISYAGCCATGKEGALSALHSKFGLLTLQYCHVRLGGSGYVVVVSHSNLPGPSNSLGSRD